MARAVYSYFYSYLSVYGTIVGMVLVIYTSSEATYVYGTLR